MKLLIIAIVGTITFHSFSQFELSGQYRPRAEYRQGFKQLFESKQSPAFFIDQRTRLKSNYSNDKIEFGFILQDYRTWGNTSQLNTTDDGLSIHEAWGKILINKHNNLKVGRQEIVFDNARIFGNVDWAQQGRKHDALLYQLKKKHSLNIGFAYNANNASLTNYGYTVPNNYKVLSFARSHLDFNKTDLSILLISTGRTGTEPLRIYYEQTAGLYIHRELSEKIKMEVEAFYQFGENKSGERKSAYLAAANLKHEVNDKFFYGAGADILSGHNLGETSNGFDPLFGTHHKFYGHMDYFYVGNSHGNNGLQDYYLTIGGKVLKKYKYVITNHYFLSNNPLNNTEHKLGIETDCILKYALNEYATLSGGYSLMIADENMRTIKEGYELINHWGWLMLDIKASFFKSNKK